MPLVLPEPPAGGVEAVESALKQIRSSSGLTFRALNLDAVRAEGEESPPPVDLALPHEVYRLELRDLSAGSTLSAVKRANWRYLVMGGPDAVAAADVAAPKTDSGETGGAAEFLQVTRGPFAQATVQALSEAEGLESVQGEDFEVRFLEVPALYVAALWLHGTKQGPACTIVSSADSIRSFSLLHGG